MNNFNLIINLQGSFLLASPLMDDPRFRNSLIYICEHNDKGTMGLIINQPLKLTFANLCQQIGLENRNLAIADNPIYYGGPINPNRGLVLHNPLGNWQATIHVDNEVGITHSSDIIEAMCSNQSPEIISPSSSMIVLGYASWAHRQLENEISENVWLNFSSDKKVIFETPPEERLDKVLAQAGINKVNLVAKAGHA